jgi:hypothetical protein
MKDKFKSRFFFIAYGLANLGLVLYGLLALFQPGILLEPFSLYVYEFPIEAAGAVRYLAALFRLLGAFNLLLGGLGLSLLWQHRLNQQKWILFTVMASSLLSYIAPIVFDNTVGHIGFFEILEHTLFVAMIAAGIIMLRGGHD